MGIINLAQNLHFAQKHALYCWKKMMVHGILNIKSYKSGKKIVIIEHVKISSNFQSDFNHYKQTCKNIQFKNLLLSIKYPSSKDSTFSSLIFKKINCKRETKKVAVI